MSFAAFDVGVGNFLPRNGLRGGDGGVDFFFDDRNLSGREGCGGEVETQAVGCDEGTLLGGVGRNDFVKSPVEKVGRGVVGFDGTTAVCEDAKGDLVADLELSLGRHEVGAGGADLLCARNEVFRVAAFVEHLAFVTLLATHLGVEGGLVGDDEELVLGGVKLEDGGFAFVVIEADEVGGRFGLEVEGF